MALVLSSQGFPNADAVFALLLGGYILWSALQIGYESIQTLLDRQLPEDECQQIRDICCAVDGVRGIHDLKTRLSGPVRFIQLHLELDDELQLVKAHELADMAEQQLKKQFPVSDILIHMDPVSVLTKENVHHES